MEIGGEPGFFLQVNTKNLNKCPCGIRELKAQKLLPKGEAHGRAPVHCTSSTRLPWGLTKCKKATGNLELCVCGREKSQTHAQSRDTEGEKGKLLFEAADARETSRGLGVFCSNPGLGQSTVHKNVWYI